MIERYNARVVRSWGGPSRGQLTFIASRHRLQHLIRAGFVEPADQDDRAHHADLPQQQQAEPQAKRRGRPPKAS